VPRSTGRVRDERVVAEEVHRLQISHRLDAPS
jgi:hypothetical protein